MDVGTDIKSTWEFTPEGDLQLATDEDNISQAVANRLGCYQPNMRIYYDTYGGFLMNYFGRRKTDETLKFMKIEVDTILSQEPRISQFNTDLSYGDDGGVRVDLVCELNDETLDLSLVLENTGGVSVAD